ncbi:flagellar biosynthesis protein FliQ [Fodinicurvata sediminis]|uniref:flagellar biosynthesis protein FliQ n=1 Tax=Fodinicurvata sediminis TaxID=1121832 RepID=UPI0003B634BA|nr:flagellar biosynthesis protein FliQ [Fodinicurvata sediminis]
MEAVEAIAVTREAVWVMLKVSGPILLVALAVGLVIALFQALTQMQEMTLSFVPKILAIFVSIILFLPFMLSTLTEFTEGLVDYIVASG